MEPTTKNELIEGVLKNYKYQMISQNAAIQQIQKIVIDSRISWKRESISQIYGWFPFDKYLPMPKDIEIIGNTYENPELINSKTTV